MNIVESGIKHHSPNSIFKRGLCCLTACSDVVLKMIHAFFIMKGLLNNFIFGILQLVEVGKKADAVISN